MMKSILFAAFILSGCASAAKMALINPFSIESEIQYYAEYYKSMPGLSGYVELQLQAAENSSAYERFLHARNNEAGILRAAYYEASPNESSYLFAYLSKNLNECTLVVAQSQASATERYAVPCNSFDGIPVPPPENSDQLIYDGTWSGLVVIDPEGRSKHYHSVNPNAPLGSTSGEQLIEKVRSIFGR